jgi:hypothetical protein
VSTAPSPGGLSECASGSVALAELTPAAARHLRADVNPCSSCSLDRRSHRHHIDAAAGLYDERHVAVKMTSDYLNGLTCYAW